MDYDLILLIIWLALCANVYFTMWVYLQIDNIKSESYQINYLKKEIADLKDKNAKMLDLMSANNIRKRR